MTTARLQHKEWIYNLIEKGSHGKKIYLVFDYIITTLILLSVFAVIGESVADINARYGAFLSHFENFCLIVFSFEYLMRLYVSDRTHPAKTRLQSALKFMCSGYGLIDLLAILPFYLPMLIKADLRFLRILRLIRFIRILKIGRYNDSLNLIWQVIREKRPELAVSGFVAFLIILIASFTMYHLEGDKQPEAFPNILAAFWWAIATLTTVGYGDICPVTPSGKLLSGFIAVLGIGVVALPTGLISAGFIHKVNSREKGNFCPHCGKRLDDH